VLLTVLGVHCPPVGEDSANRLRQLFEVLDARLGELCTRAPDAVHDGVDYAMFAVCLTLTAAGALKRKDLIFHRRDWGHEAARLCERMTPRSRASQGLFYVSALISLGLQEETSEFVVQLTRRAIEEYVATACGDRLDDYLRCTYLAHWARLTGQAEHLAPVWRVLRRFVDSDHASSLHSGGTYSSGPMVASYLLTVMRDFPETECGFCAADIMRVMRAFAPDPTGAAPLRLQFALFRSALPTP
jgi:hypothetical protein